MKKTILLVLVLVLALSLLTACGSNDNTGSTGGNSTPGTSQGGNDTTPSNNGDNTSPSSDNDAPAEHDNKLVGSWIQEGEYSKEGYIFNANGTFAYYWGSDQYGWKLQHSGTWSTNGTTLTDKWTTGIEEKFTYSADGSSITLSHLGNSNTYRAGTITE